VPADLTYKWIFKNGDRPQDVYASIFGGLDGSRMPAYASEIPTESDRWALVAYVLSLSPASRPVLHLDDFATQRATRIGANGRVLPNRHAP
jgi:mono/diheme cytochrome c family protein